MSYTNFAESIITALDTTTLTNEEKRHFLTNIVTCFEQIDEDTCEKTLQRLTVCLAEELERYTPSVQEQFTATFCQY